MTRSILFAAIVALGLAFSLSTSTLGAEPDIIPAGFGCSFDVLVEPEQKDGAAAAHMPIGFGNITLTNMDTGASILTKSRYTLTETVDPDTNQVFVEIKGRFLLVLWPGDQGPLGEVQEPGMLIRVVGDTRFTADLETEVVTAFAIKGHVTDMCVLLAGP